MYFLTNFRKMLVFNNIYSEKKNDIFLVFGCRFKNKGIKLKYKIVVELV